MDTHQNLNRHERRAADAILRHGGQEPLAERRHQIRSLKEFAAQAGISMATLRRLIAAKDGPRITQLSPRRLGVRDDHGQEWLDARAS